MKRFALAAVLGSMRQLLAITIALLAVAGAFYLSGHKLNNPDHYRFAGCPSQGFVYHDVPPPCMPPTRAAWQIPLAVMVTLIGLGAAVTVAGERRP
jgi:hypothetical protein